MRAMKDSGIEWIGEIPESWSICKLKNVATIITGNTPSKSNGDCYYADEGMMWVKPDNLTGSTPITETNEYLSSEGIEMAKVVSPHTPLVCCIGSIGKIGISEQSVAFNQQINAVDYNESVDRRYGLYYLMSQEEQHKMRANGNVLLILNSEQQGLIPFLLPPREVQTDIALYLDKKCAEIDALIAAKERTNALLRERRQSIIYEAVTKGLDPTVPMKDSGVEWIGEIPESWITTRIKYTSTLKGRIGWQGLKSDEYIDEGPFLITGVDFVNGRIDWENCAHISNERYEEAPEIHIFEGDLLITKDGTIGKLAIAEICPNEVSLNSGVLLIRNNERGEYLNKYLYYVLQSDVFWKWFKLSQNGNSTIIHLYQEQFSNFRYALPSIKEQQVIVDFLDNGCFELESLISANETTIEKLKEYRQSVIYEAVTGKIEV